MGRLTVKNFKGFESLCDIEAIECHQTRDKHRICVFIHIFIFSIFFDVPLHWRIIRLPVYSVDRLPHSCFGLWFNFERDETLILMDYDRSAQHTNTPSRRVL